MGTHYWISTSSTSFSTAANWSDAAAPANDDVLIFNHLGTANCTTDLGSSITGATLIVEKSYTGQIGVLDGATATYLTLSGGTLHLERPAAFGSGTGSNLIMVDTGTAADGVAYIYDSSSSSSTTYYPPILLKGGDADNELTIYQSGGYAGIGVVPGEAPYVKVYMTKGNGSLAPSMYIGAGANIVDITQYTGTITNLSDNAATAIRVEGDGVFHNRGAGAATALSLYGNARFYHQGTGAIPTLNITGASIYRDQATGAVTIGGTAFNIGPNSKFYFNNGKASSITRSNKALTAGTLWESLTIQLPAGEQF